MEENRRDAPAESAVTERRPSGRGRATAAGFAAIALWSLSVALSRALSEALGPMRAGAFVYALAGALAMGVLVRRPDRRRELAGLPRKYLCGCGALFVAYTVVFYAAIGLARTRQQALEVALLNYLWPALTLLFAVLLLRVPARSTLLPAMALALAGVFLVQTHGTPTPLHTFAANWRAAPLPYALGLLAAVLWGLYSALARKWAGGRGGGVLVFLPVSAAALLPLALPGGAPHTATGPRVLAEIAALGTASFLGYRFWDTAMRRGRIVLVAAASFLTPLFSTIVSCLYLRVRPGWDLWAGCLLLVAGSFWSWRSVPEDR